MLNRRIEGARKVTGRTAFTEDLPVAGLSHARLVTSYVASGSIRCSRVRVQPSTRHGEPTRWHSRSRSC